MSLELTPEQISCGNVIEIGDTRMLNMEPNRETSVSVEIGVQLDEEVQY